MLKAYKKTQISIEALLILSILIIGAVVAGYFYFGNIRTQTGQSDELSSLTDSFLNQFGNDVNPNNPIYCNYNNSCEPNLGETAENCRDCDITTICDHDNICESQQFENSDNCDDCLIIGEINCDYDTFCEPILGETVENCRDCSEENLIFGDFRLTLFNPDGDSEVDSSFSLEATVNSNYGNIEIFAIQLNKKNSSGNWEFSDKCKIDGIAPEENGYPLNPIPMDIDTDNSTHKKVISDIICSEEGEYKFIVSIRPNSFPSTTLNASVIKNITSQTQTNYSLLLKILSPESGAVYRNNESIELSSEYQVSPQVFNVSISCVWTDSKGNILSEICGGDLINASDLEVGSHEIQLFVTANLGDDLKPLLGNTKTNIHVIPQILLDQLYLSVPNKTYVNDIFNIRIYSTNSNIVNQITTNDLFTFNPNVCSILDQVNTTENITSNNQSIYYKDFPATCNLPVYDNCPDTLGPITVETNNATAEFKSELDLRPNGATCTTSSANNFGILNICIFEDSGLNFSDFCTNLQNTGILKLNINIAENSVSDPVNGSLKIYIE